MSKLYKTKYHVNHTAILDVEAPNWEINDDYGHVKSQDIIQNGINTGYRMVYKEIQERPEVSKVWIPVGAVSKNWEPCPTSPIVDMVRGQLISAGIMDEDTLTQVKMPSRDLKCTTHKVSMRLNVPIEVPRKPRDAGSRFTGLNSDGGSNDMYFPQVTLWNGYSGCCSLQAGLSMLRMVCSNGLTIMKLTGKIRNLHTERSIQQFVNSVARKDFLSEAKELVGFINKTADISVTAEVMESIKGLMNKADEESWKEYPDTSINGLINFLSYQQTHKASISSEVRYQQMINRVYKQVA
jgi:hypothetical protein